MRRRLRETRTRRNSTRGLMPALAPGLFGLFAALPAWAQCAPDPPGPGATVTCTGSDNDGFAAPANTPLTINVVPGGTVQQAPATGQAVTFGLNTAGNVLNNNGSIAASGNAAAALTGVTFFSGTGAGTSILNNFSSISATNAGAGNALAVSLLQGNAISTIRIVNATGATIAGTATGGGAGVGVNQNFAVGASARSLVIDNSGIIRGSTNAFAAGTGASSAAQTIVINNGFGGAAAQINGGTGAAITFAGNGLNTLNNLATGTINGDIVSTGNASIVIDNSGVIRDVLVVRQQGIVRTEQFSDLGRVVDADVEVRVVADPRRQMQRAGGGRTQTARRLRLVTPASSEKGRDATAKLCARGRAEREKAVEAALCAGFAQTSILRHEPAFQRQLEVEDLVADRDPAPARLARRAEDTDRQVLDGKVGMAVRGRLETAKRRVMGFVEGSHLCLRACSDRSVSSACGHSRRSRPEARPFLRRKR